MVWPQRYIDCMCRPSRNSVYGVDLVDTLTRLAIGRRFCLHDKYLFIRDAYLQRRKFLYCRVVIWRMILSDDRRMSNLIPQRPTLTYPFINRL